MATVNKCNFDVKVLIKLNDLINLFSGKWRLWPTKSYNNDIFLFLITMCGLIEIFIYHISVDNTGISELLF